MDNCQMCETETGRHHPGTVARRERCGCDVAGIGLLPNPWHIHKCPLHAAAPALLEALESLYACNVWYGQIDDGDKARLLTARAAIAQARGESNG